MIWIYGRKGGKNKYVTPKFEAWWVWSVVALQASLCTIVGPRFLYFKKNYLFFKKFGKWIIITLKNDIYKFKYINFTQNFYKKINLTIKKSENFIFLL